MELRHLRYFVAVGEEQHLRAGCTEVARRGAFLQRVNEATSRAQPVARGQSGTLRIGFTENASWHGVVPDSFRRFRAQQPDAELQLNPLASLEQIDAIRSGRLDAGFVFNMPKTDPKVDHVQVARQNVALAAPKGHPVAKLKTLRLRDLVAVSLISFPRRESPAFYDRLMHECFRGGLKSPHIVQEAVNEVTILSLVSHGMGVGFVTAHALAVSSRMEDGHWIPIARKICPRCSRLTGSPSIGECS